MMEDGEITYSVSYATIWALFIFLLLLLILLFVLYKYLNKQSNGKYTVERVVLREGGLRDRARGAAVALGNRLGVQLWPQTETDEDGEYEEDEDEEEEEANSNRNESSDDEGGEDVVLVAEQRSGSMTGVNDAGGSSGGNSVDGSDEEEQAEANPEPESKAEAGKRAEDGDVQEETNAPIVISLNQFSGSVLWSEEEKCEGGDVTAL